MPDYQYLIIGGGMTADAAVGGIREVDAEGSIGVVSSEEDPPYRRPPLSKGLWKGMKLDRIGYRTSEQADLHTGKTIQTLDTAKKRAVATDGEEFGYGKLLLATGGRPRRLPFDAEGVRSRTLSLFEGGTFNGFLFDSYSARRMGRKTTGAAGRTLSAPPSPGTSNLVLAPGAQPAAPRALAMVTPSASSQSSGACSAQPGRG